MEQVKTRFAPSPTGMMHIGNVRTALYAYLLAKKNKGTFILRIEDTDRERFVEGATDEIMNTLKWLGINWDEGPIFQSERLDIYKKYAQELIEKNAAYEKDGAIWFKTNKEGATSWMDAVGNKKITIENKIVDDFVMIKSDGYPTYNFAVVIDDHLMGISHVIRGVEFISSTPKHIMVYQALGWALPTFVHLPVFLGSDRSKLSKRHGAQAASDYRKDGFLPEAILNYMALLSWTPPSGKEILSVEEMVKEFDLKDVHISNPIFDVTKLEWMNGEYIRKTENSQLKTQIWAYLQYISKGAITEKDHPNEGDIEKVVPLIKERIKKLSDFIPLTDFLFEEPEYDREVFNKIKVENKKEKLEKIADVMEKMEKPWKADIFEKTFRELAEELSIKTVDMFQLIRVAISGQLVTPPLFESIQILGEEETLGRISRVTKEFPNLS